MPEREYPRRGGRPSLLGPAEQALDDEAAGWLIGAGRGDQRAMAALYDSTAPRVFGFLVNAVGDSRRAAQVCERAYLQVWRTAPWFIGTGRSAYAVLLAAACWELMGPPARPPSGTGLSVVRGPEAPPTPPAG